MKFAFCQIFLYQSPECKTNAQNMPCNDLRDGSFIIWGDAPSAGEKEGRLLKIPKVRGIPRGFPFFFKLMIINGLSLNYNTKYSACIVLAVFIYIRQTHLYTMTLQIYFCYLLLVIKNINMALDVLHIAARNSFLFITYLLVLLTWNLRRFIINLFWISQSLGVTDKGNHSICKQHSSRKLKLKVFKGSSRRVIWV